MREGKHQWEQPQEVASSYVTVLFIKKPFVRNLERINSCSGSIYKQTAFLLFSVYLLFWTQCLISQYPPQVGKYTYNYVRKKTRAYTVGMWRWWTCLCLETAWFLPLAPSKKAIAQSPLSLATYSCKRDATPLRVFNAAARDHADRTTMPTSMRLLLCKLISLPLHAEPVDIQMYCSPLNRKRRTDNRRTASPVALVLPNKLIFERDQKKDGKPPKPVKPTRPEPVKPTKPNTRKKEPGREGDKEKQDENEPRTKGPVLSIILLSQS